MLESRSMQTGSTTKSFNPRAWVVLAAFWAFFFGLRLADLFNAIDKHDQLWLWEHGVITLVMGLLPILYLLRAWQFIPTSAPWTSVFRRKPASSQPQPSVGAS